uniref:Putative salivary kunitz domain protein n=1 Tax=Ixodes ricinus TaxID=34613 RepID=A0A0K8RCG6_IXORI
MSGIKLILLFSHICIVYAVGDDVGGIDQKPILQEKNEPGIPENRGASSKAGTTKCNTTKTTCPPRPTKWHFNGLVGRCERDTRSFCGGTENTFVNFKECQEKCEEAAIESHRRRSIIQEMTYEIQAEIKSTLIFTTKKS